MKYALNMKATNNRIR